MLGLLRSSLVFRTTLSVVVVVLLVGMLFSTIALSLMKEREHSHAADRLEELLNTVESTTSISCFLRDKSLADEITRGLMKSRIVESVTLLEEGLVLAQAGLSNARTIDSTGQLTRELASPFNPQQKHCKIILRPNEAVIAEQVSKNTRPIFYLLVMQAVAVALTIVFVVWKWITQPIASISNQLHRLPVADGAALLLPKRQGEDEISRMVRDVNALIVRLLRTLNEERALRHWREQEEKRFRTIFEKAETGIFVSDGNGQISSHNPAFTRILNLQDAGPAGEQEHNLPALLGVSVDRFAELITLSTKENRVVTADFCVNGGDGCDGKWLNLVLNPMDEGLLQGLINDITERKQAEVAANRLALTDALTGLANRLGFEQRFSRIAGEYALNPSTPYFLMLIDLDGFKHVNDTYGHDAGDLVLQHVARQFESVVRKTDFVCRLGGDEFAILLHSGIKREGVERIAQQLIAMTAIPIALFSNGEVRIGASVGIAIAVCGYGKERMFKDADMAMYRAKHAGKNTYFVHESAPI